MAKCLACTCKTLPSLFASVRGECKSKTKLLGFQLVAVYGGQVENMIKC